MSSALIGYTGFVGGNIKTQYDFDDLYNSKNIEQIKGKKYDLIVSAGTPALRWKANKEPKEDWSSIKRLIDNLAEVEASQFVLISTIDVYPEKSGVDEDTLIKIEDLTEPYGLHRFKLEEFVRDRFDNHTIIRCPQIYGLGVVKGFVYDLIHDNAFDFTHKDSKLQFYSAQHFKKDIDVAIDNNLSLVNFAVEPISASEVAKFTRKIEFGTITEKPPFRFDMQTKHADLYGKKGRYLYRKAETLSQLKNFILNEREKL